MDSVHWTVEFFLKEMLNKCFNFATILFDIFFLHQRWCWAILMDLNWLRAFFNVDGAEINGWAHFLCLSFLEMSGKTTVEKLPLSSDMCVNWSMHGWQFLWKWGFGKVAATQSCVNTKINLLMHTDFTMGLRTFEVAKFHQVLRHSGSKPTRYRWQCIAPKTQHQTYIAPKTKKQCTKDTLHNRNYTNEEPPKIVSRPTRWSLWYWYLVFYVDHLVGGWDVPPTYRRL